MYGCELQSPCRGECCLTDLLDDFNGLSRGNEELAFHLVSVKNGRCRPIYTPASLSSRLIDIYSHGPPLDLFDLSIKLHFFQRCLMEDLVGIII